MNAATTDRYVCTNVGDLHAGRLYLIEFPSCDNIGTTDQLVGRWTGKHAATGAIVVLRESDEQKFYLFVNEITFLEEVEDEPKEAAEVQAGEFVVTLRDNDPHPLRPVREVRVRVTQDEGYLCITPEGYGVNGAEDGKAACVFLEVRMGELRIGFMPDVNQDDVDVYSLEGAREELRGK